jgi:hypothetical protein
MANKGIAEQLIVKVSTNEGNPCPLCDYHLDGISRFEEAGRHLMRDHGMVCLHVGTETIMGGNGQPWHTTVAVYGV